MVDGHEAGASPACRARRKDSFCPFNGTEWHHFMSALSYIVHHCALSMLNKSDVGVLRKHLLASQALAAPMFPHLSVFKATDLLPFSAQDNIFIQSLYDGLVWSIILL